MAVIEAEGLVKIYRSRKHEVRALDGVDLEVPEGTVLGLLGPNGAGKTTTVRVLSTLLRADAGSARIAGLDIARDAQVSAEADRPLGPVRRGRREPHRPREPLDVRPPLPARRRPRPSSVHPSCSRRSTSTAAADRVTKTYSGGMRRRLDLASALIGRPQLPLPRRADHRARPRSRLGMWEVIRNQVRQGDDAAAHDPVSRGGRRAGRRDRSRRCRQDHRPRHR